MATEPMIIEQGAQSSAINPKVALIVIVAIVLVIILLFYYFYKQGQNQGQPSVANLPPQANLANGGTITQGTLTNYAQQIHAALPAYQPWYTEIMPGNSSIFGQIMSANLNSTDLVNLYNTYNALFWPQGNGNLVSDLQAGTTSV